MSTVEGFLAFVLFWDSHKQNKWRQMNQVTFFFYWVNKKADKDRQNQGTKHFKNWGFVKQGSGYSIVKHNGSNNWIDPWVLSLTRSVILIVVYWRVLVVCFVSEGYYRHWVDATWGRTSVLLCVDGTVPHTCSAPLRLSNVLLDIYAGPTVCLGENIWFPRQNVICPVLLSIKVIPPFPSP